jgi:hypothetical protein
MKSGIYRLTVLFIIVLIYAPATAQIYPRYAVQRDTAEAPTLSKKPLLIFQIENENGGMIANNAQVKEDFNDIYYNGVNLRVGWQTRAGSDPYHQRHNFPIYGIGLYSSTFHKPEIGTPVALYGFVAIPIKPARFSRWDFNYRISLGIASDFRPFDEEENPLNIMLGTKRNVYIDLGAQANYRLGKHFQLGAGLAFKHFSNGSIKQPNKGINLIPTTLSVTYYPKVVGDIFRKQAVEPFENNFALHINYAAGVKQLNPENEKRYFKSTLGAYISRSLGAKWRLGAGGDLYYSASGNDALVAGSDAGEAGALLSGGPAFYIDHILTSRLYLNGNVGYYLHRNDFNGEVGPMFLRIGVRYKLMREMYAGVSIKAHAGKADYIEWTLGYSLPRIFSGKNKG